MSEKEFLDSTQPFLDLLQATNRLGQYKEKMEQISQIEDEDTYKSMTKMVDSSMAIVKKQKDLIGSMLNKLNSMVDDRKIPRNYTIPSKEELKDRFNEFLQMQLPTVSSPYPHLCGALAWPSDKIVPNNSFVCAPNGDLYILAIVLGFDPETYTYQVTDALPEDEVIVFDVQADKVIPLPTSLPARKNKLVIFPVKSRVLALWFDDLGWTSVFYPATVLQQPTNNTSMYNLKFDGDPPISAPIPERFVVKEF
ncbi:hypothetical protein TRFO_17759 [Tritrichomonas foetus]|uniref:SGF29 C-terminal domain-containing protein n=1 Tax=Tritrichomonas foetus TaxID=1144522 RepID=A0A1J4KME4_9EUKA|nr:hypothetical protein TRFO_17759 [Tritrichomonas foetus]|eukprot:OHT12395.1 hypothetical protein TRFO_17759 [Tritrichomonas foetus]